MNMKLLELKY